MFATERQRAVLDRARLAGTASGLGEPSDVDVIVAVIVTDSALDPDVASDGQSAGPQVVRA